MAVPGKTIGSANIRILPNTSNFANSLERYLDRVEKRIRAQIGVVVDSDQLVSDMRRATAAAKKAAGPVEVDTEANSEKLGEDVKKAAKAAKEAAGPVELEPDIDSSEVAKEAEEAKERAEEHLDGITAKIKLNIDRFIAKTRAVAKAASEHLVVKAVMKLDTKPFLASLAAVTAASKVVGSFFGGGLLSSLAALPQAMGAISVGVVALSGIAPALAGIAAAAGQATAAVAGLSAVLVPAAVAGGAALATMVLAFRGLGAAINETDPEKFADALGELPPAAQDAVIAIRGLKQQFNGLGDTIKEKFWGAFNNIGDLAVLLEPLKRAMSVIADEMGVAASRMVDFVSHGVGLSAMKTLLHNSSFAAASLSEAFADTVRGLIAVGAAASPVFESIASGIADVAYSWAERMSAAFADGSLTAYFQNAQEVVSRFFEVLGQLGGIVSGVFSAMNAAGQPFLGTIGQVVEATNEWVNSAAGMETLVEFFSAMSGAVAAVLPIIGQLAGIIGTTLAPAIAGFIQQIAPAVSLLVDGLGQGLQAVAPALQPVAAAFTAVAQALAPVLPAIGSAIGALVSSLMPALAAIAPIVGRLLEAFAGIVEALAPIAPAIVAVVAGFAAFQAVAGFLAPIIEVIGGISAPVIAAVAAIGLLVAAFASAPEALAPLKEAFSGLMESLAPIGQVLADFGTQIVAALQPLAEALVPVITQIVDLIAQILVAVTPIIAMILQVVAVIISALVPVLIELIPAISAIVGAFLTIVSALTPVIAIIAQVVGAFLTLLATIIGFVARALAAIISFVVRVIAGFINMIVTVVSAVVGFVGKVVTFFADLGTSAGTKAREMWERVKSAFSSGVSAAISFVSQLPGKAKAALGNVGSILISSGRALIQGFINGIKSMIGAIANAVSSAVSTARSYFPFSPAKVGPFSGRGWTLYSGRSVGEAFAAGIEDSTSNAAAASKRLMKATARNLDGYTASSGRLDISATGQGVASSSGGDFSLNVGTIVAADPMAPLREAADLQLKARIKAGVI